MITEQQLNEFIDLYRFLYGIELDRDIALIIAQKLIVLTEKCLDFSDIY